MGTRATLAAPSPHALPGLPRLVVAGCRRGSAHGRQPGLGAMFATTMVMSCTAELWPRSASRGVTVRAAQRRRWSVVAYGCLSCEHGPQAGVGGRELF